MLDSPLAPVLVFCLGLGLGGGVNWAIYRLSYWPRAISPWSAAPAPAPPRGWADRLPVVGWFRLRRESAWHERHFWWRPLIVELLTALLLTALYIWEVQQRGLVPPEIASLVPASHFLPIFLAHAILVPALVIASFIDLDEKNIPDSVTVPGTLCGLLLAALAPSVLLPVIEPDAIGFLTVSSPHPWPAALAGYPVIGSLLLGISIFWIWCLGLLPRPLRLRRGWGVGLSLLMRRMTGGPTFWPIMAMGLLGSLVIVAVWFVGETHWQGLCTALVGMIVGGGIIWLVRIIAAVVMRREAMGFGDVTLMAMIGAYLGWQPMLFVFFLAPLFGLALGVAQWILRREPEIPYGPFLCLAAGAVIYAWVPLWNWAEPIFALGWMVPIVLLSCMFLLAVLLGLLELLKALFGFR